MILKKKAVVALPVAEETKKGAKKSTSTRKPSVKAANTKIHPSTKVGKGGVKGNYLCVCGCGGKTNATFLRGHVQRVRGWIRRIKMGEGTPKAVGMPHAILLALGPWRKKDGGMVPAKSYTTLIRKQDK